LEISGGFREGVFVASADDISWKKIRISLQLRDLHPSDMDPSWGPGAP
jgi:hypothetical protein